jgi:hypothetical protein
MVDDAFTVAVAVAGAVAGASSTTSSTASAAVSFDAGGGGKDSFEVAAGNPPAGIGGGKAVAR